MSRCYTLLLLTFNRNNMIVTLDISTTGDFEEQELLDFIEFNLGFGSLKQDNPFINEDFNAEITSVNAEIVYST